MLNIPQDAIAADLGVSASSLAVSSVVSVFCLGGLLGDDPPQGDITGLLRVEGFTMRHLNERQVSLVSDRQMDTH